MDEEEGVVRMEYLKFQLFSMMELLGVLYLIFTLFKLEFKSMFTQVLFVSFLLSQLSYYLRMEIQVPSAVVTISYEICLILLFWLLFHVKFKFSLVLGTVTALITITLQSVMIMTALAMNWIKLEEVRPFTPTSEVLALFFVLICMLLSFWSKENGIHITFNLQKKARGHRSRSSRIKMLIFIVLFIVVNWIIYLNLMHVEGIQLAYAGFLMGELVFIVWILSRVGKDPAVDQGYQDFVN
ncbi:hypothetical protein [Marinicrinis sediminis]|uniref:Uncharacterized protein n=1 Tax=Marinicrinis sediminis TaxID=1652465 RepID=A0ABW5RCH4_9BACL